MAICPNHPDYILSSRLGKLYEPMDECLVCWTAYINSKYEDTSEPVEGRDMVKLMMLYNKELEILGSASIQSDNGFADPEYER